VITPDPNRVASDIVEVIQEWNSHTDRGKQTLAKGVGISDIGHCREYVRLMTVEENFTDDPSKIKAFLGTWVGEGVEQAMKVRYPQAKLKMETTVELPSGVRLLGHPDVVMPKGVWDIKTVDGLTEVLRHGPSETNQFQRHLYAGGLVQQGILPKDCYVGNIFIDRSGRWEEPYVNVESYDPTWLVKADEWMSDVLYAVRTGEEANKDQPLDFCQKCCEYFSTCRGDDVVSDREEGGLITDSFVLDFVDAYINARDEIKELENVKKDAQRALASTSGSTGTHMVRWTHVNPVDVPGYTRAGYDKLDIRPLPKPRTRKKK
jgi:hypothetical protein